MPCVLISQAVHHQTQEGGLPLSARHSSGCRTAGSADRGEPGTGEQNNVVYDRTRCRELDAGVHIPLMLPWTDQCGQVGGCSVKEGKMKKMWKIPWYLWHSQETGVKSRSESKQLQYRDRRMKKKKCPPSDGRRIAEWDRSRGLRESLNFRRLIGEGGRHPPIRSGASSGDDGNRISQG